MKAALVTGATAPIGRMLVEDLAADPRVERVLAVGVEPGWRAGFLPSEKLHYLQADLSRSRGLRELLFGPARDLGVQAVVHSALHRRARDEGPRLRRLNVESTRELLHLCERHPTIRRVVFRSTTDVYRVRPDQPTLVDEEHPLDLSAGAPQWLRHRLEADLTVCTRMGLSHLHLVVLRAPECLAPGTGSQLYDWLSSPVCLRPLGFDPMMNLVSIEDAARALRLALFATAEGVFNVPGRDTLPLSAIARRWRRIGVPVPGFALAPLYGLRSLATGTDFRWDLNLWRFRWSAVPDGRRAREVLGYEPLRGIDWPS